MSKENKEQFETQFTAEELNTPNPASIDLYGDWARDPAAIAALREQFVSADPFPYVIIPNFFKQEVAEQIEQEFPSAEAPIWFRYNNPIERKLAQNNLNRVTPHAQRALRNVNTPESVQLMTQLTGIETLEADPYLHGGGIHAHPRGGKLDMHLDYSIHPITGKERRVNLIVYLNKVWSPEYGGGLQLWDKDMQKMRVTVPVDFNMAVLFRTSDMSYHGLPDPVKCPEGMMRKSLAVYYVTDPRPDATHRYKAQFFARPSDPHSEFIDRLRAIRPQRRIEASDMVGWEEEEARLQALGFDI